MELQQPQMERWEGKVNATVQHSTCEQAWLLLSNFCDFHVWHPGVKVCRKKSGTIGVPGCVRYCQGPDREDGQMADWANEELLSFDPVGRVFTYKMMENNMGFGQFTATFRVSDAKKVNLKDSKGCELEWSFECEPINGTPKKALIARLQAGLNGMASRVDETTLRSDRWEGKVTATVWLATCEQAWQLLSKFCDFHVWHPGVKVCRIESGTIGVPGCVRYCQGPNPEDGGMDDWAYQELLTFDPVGHVFTYKMMENNMGFGQFTATFRVNSDAKKANLKDAKGCELEWSFEGEPINGKPKEALISRLQAALTGMASRVDETCLLDSGSYKAGSNGSAKDLACISSGL